MEPREAPRRRVVPGADAGPSPYQLLLSGLGACKAMTVRMYADRKGWDLDEVHVALRHERRHADDCVDCESDSTRITHIDTEIQFTGDLTGEQRERLREIAGRCPVEKTITGDLRVVTRLVESE